MKLMYHEISMQTLIEHAASDENASATWAEYRRIKDAGGRPVVYYERRMQWYRVEDRTTARR